MLKKIILFTVILYLLPTFVNAVEVPKISVQTTFTDPYPVEPGKNLELSIEILNTGDKEAKDVIVEIEPVEPFTLLESSKKEISILPIDGTRIIEYDMFVDSSAVSTTYEIPVHITYETYYKLTKSIEIQVQGTPEFELLSMRSETISPGDQAEISVLIQNVGTGKAKRTAATFSSASTYIKPVLAGGNVYIGDIDPGKKKRIEFTILASSDSEYGVYTGTINLTYEDESGNELIEKFDVGILISGEPKFQIVKSEVEREEGKLSVEIVNIGTAEAKAITAKLIVDNKTFDTDYVTSVKIDKRSTLKFILPRSTRAELELSYEGPDNEEYSQTKMIAWSISTTFPVWVWIVVILVIGYVVWKKKLWKKII